MEYLTNAINSTIVLLKKEDAKTSANNLLEPALNVLKI